MIFYWQREDRELNLKKSLQKKKCCRMCIQRVGLFCTNEVWKTEKIGLELIRPARRGSSQKWRNWKLEMDSGSKIVPGWSVQKHRCEYDRKFACETFLWMRRKLHLEHPESIYENMQLHLIALSFLHTLALVQFCKCTDVREALRVVHQSGKSKTEVQDRISVCMFTMCL